MWKKLLASAAIAGITVAQIAQGANLTTSASIQIRGALALTEAASLNFGTIEQPSSDVVVHVTTSNTVGSNNTATFVDQSGIRAGEITVTGSEISNVSIQAQDVGNVPGLSFTSITGNYGGAGDVNLVTGTNNQTPPGAEGTSLALGAELQVASSVTEGNYSPQIAIEVNYD